MITDGATASVGRPTPWSVAGDRIDSRAMPKAQKKPGELHGVGSARRDDLVSTAEVAMTKRADGALEHDIMAVLWAAREALLPAEIQARLPNELAYTSVATVLGRLQTKGLVERRVAGRAFAYRATVDESGLAARRINEVLSSTSDRRAALVGFVGSLSKRDAKALRALLDESAP